MYSAVLCVAWMVMRSNPHQCLWTHDLQVPGSERLSFHVDLYTVSRCRTRGAFEDHTGSETQSKMSPEVQNRGTSGPITMTCAPKHCLKKLTCPAVEYHKKFRSVCEMTQHRASKGITGFMNKHHICQCH